MEYREFGRTGWKISAVSFGCWAIGGTWGKVDDKESMEALHAALDHGVNFFDTADVYGDGHSERLLARLRKERSEYFYIATKAGRRLNPHTPEGYNKKNIVSFVNRSLVNLNTDCLDLLQLHCPPKEVYYMPEVFNILDNLSEEGKIKYYGVSVEKVEEGLKAMEYPNVQSIQIIFNMFRMKPSELLFRQAVEKKTGILARVPLASGLLTGKLKEDTQFEKEDHRNFNRDGDYFDRGETFSGVKYSTGLEAVEELKSICPAGISLAQFALRWILMFKAVTCAIPGAKRIKQVEENVKAADLIPLDEKVMRGVEGVYNKLIRKQVHQYW